MTGTDPSHAGSLPRVAIDDVLHFLNQFEKDDDQYSRRAAIRAVFAAVEGILWSTKSFILESDRMASANLSLAEQALLREETFSLDDRGRPHTRGIGIKLSQNIRFLLGVVQRIRPDYSLDLSHRGWACLQKSLDVRHRLTHPKCANDLEVSRKEVSDAYAGFCWFLAFAIEVMEQTKEYTKLNVPKGVFLKSVAPTRKEEQQGDAQS